MDLFLGNPKNAEVGGYSNHMWNGVTTLHFAKICHGIIKENIKLPHLQHVIPGNSVSKFEMLKCFAKEFNRKDIKINKTKAPIVIDRTLQTESKKLNIKIWKAAGYQKPPTMEKMIEE